MCSEHHVVFVNVDHLLGGCKLHFPRAALPSSYVKKEKVIYYSRWNGASENDLNELNVHRKKMSINFDDSTDVSVTLYLAIVIRCFDVKKLVVER